MIYRSINTSENQVRMKTFKQYLRGLLNCKRLYYQFLIALLRFCTNQGVMETQLLTHKHTHTQK